MSDSDLESEIREIQATLDSLTSDMVDLKARLDELEKKRRRQIEREEVGVSMDEKDEEEEIEGDIRVA
ncbi:MAG: hypothetical protein ABEK59_05945 [Halobacteria archaeon]